MTDKSQATGHADGEPPRAWWSLHGKVDRWAFATAGVALLLCKYAVDCAVASLVFGRSWSAFHYLSGHQVSLLLSGSPDDRLYFSTMFVVALPFIWIGVALTVRRLRSAAMPIWLVFLFFIPTINLLFLCVMTVVPPRDRPTVGERRTDRTRFLRPWPRHPVANAFMAVLFTMIAGLVMTGLSVYVLGMYGFGLFVGVPFCMGLIASIIFGFCGYRSGAAHRFVSIVAVVGLEAVLLILGAEGLGCLFMAAPIWLVCGILGGLVGEAIQSYAVDEKEIALLTVIIVVAIPTFLGAEFILQPAAPGLKVTTQLDIDASPDDVWQNVVSFPELPAPSQWPFQMGIAYPTSATITGSGHHAIRRCEFNTGTFVEPIEVWDSPRLLRFTVTDNAPPMREWTFYDDVAPPHLDGYLVSRAGQFLLTPLAGGGTRLEGTTWYEHNMRPAGYWRIWSDLAISAIHRRVLRHIKTLSEAPRLAAQDAPSPMLAQIESEESR